MLYVLQLSGIQTIKLVNTLKVFLFLTLLFSLLFLFTGCSPKENNLQRNIQERLSVSTVNLIPDIPGTTPSYWCTWSAQNFAVDTFTLNYVIGLGDHTVPADNLTEKAVFDDPGWEKQFPEKIKKDLFIVFDAGWDIAGGSHLDKAKKWIMGTQEVASDKFPSFTGTPEERLNKLNALVKQKGWKGAGIWIAAQTSMDSRGQKPSDIEVEKYFRERMRWSRNAGINYWKVDYGSRGGDMKFREMLSRIAHEEAPDMWLENGRGSGPFNDDECPWDSPNFTKSGSYKNWDKGNVLKAAHNLLKFSDVLRTYDISAQLSIPTTIDRVVQILASFDSLPGSKGIINCEDETYIAAALGCAIGVMRHPAFITAPGHDYDPLNLKNQMDAVIRAVRWQRLSPAFSAGYNITELDSLVNHDYWKFMPGQSWAKWMTGRTVMQSAPARVSRGMQLPEVSGSDQPPYVVCSKFPGGNYAVSSFMRTDSIKGFVSPKADVSIICDKPSKIGVFGRYKTLKINFADGFRPVHIFAQDLAGNKGIEITDLIIREGSSLVFSGELLESVGLSASGTNDVSEPGLVLDFK